MTFAGIVYDLTECDYIYVWIEKMLRDLRYYLNPALKWLCLLKAIFFLLISAFCGDVLLFWPAFFHLLQTPWFSKHTCTLRVLHENTQRNVESGTAKQQDCHQLILLIFWYRMSAPVQSYKIAPGDIAQNSALTDWTPGGVHSSCIHV